MRDDAGESQRLRVPNLEVVSLTAVEKTFQVFHSFESADDAMRRDWWAMSPIERLRMTEQLRRLKYSHGRSASRLQSVFETAYEEKR